MTNNDNPQNPMGMNPEDLAAFMKNLQQAMNMMPGGTGSSGVNWQMAMSQAKETARSGAKSITDAARKGIHDGVSIGSLWLNSATAISELTSEPKLLSRELWVADAMPLFQDLTQPVANRMSAALSEQLTQNLPPELAGVLGNAGDLMKSVGGTLFAIQLGQALGKLSSEVLSGGDIGLPLFKDQRAAFVPQNLQEFVEGLGEETDQAYIYLTIREMAHVRLFKHSKWLRDHVVSQITTYASEISIDSDRISELAESLDPNDTDAIKQAIESGAFISERTDEQNQALASIENMLALIDGWVDVVTEDATRLLPRSGAIAESVRRRRATAGPAELTFGTLIGLELRPRRLREATAMWRAVTVAVGIDRRDSLWDHPDLAPTGEDINNPAALIEKLQGKSPEADDFDRALRDLLGD
jgi:putative hydrolase